jgi:RES domain-containing protein
VLYLGQPEDSVVVEAYRHFVDPVEDEALMAQIRPRILVTAAVNVDEIVDLTAAGARLGTGLSLDVLQSDPADREAYERCQEVAQVAHGLGRRGILAPAATKMGRTLALFSDLTRAAGQRPTRCAPDTLWPTLPPDPRVRERRHGMRVVRDD